jgi:hypothetical protein
MEPELRQRLAANEGTFREINESIARGQWPGDEGAPVSFRCECARLGCNLLIELTLPEYERVRDHPRRFLVASGHQVPEVETVVDSGENYLVVEKSEESGQEAARLDPRD